MSQQLHPLLRQIGVEIPPGLANPEECPIGLYLKIGVGWFLHIYDALDNSQLLRLGIGIAVRVGWDQDRKMMRVTLDGQCQRDELDPIVWFFAAGRHIFFAWKGYL